MSENPAYPDADPTAPGGMSQQALVDELLNKHGWDEDDVAPWLTAKGEPKPRAWTQMIDAVVEERRNRDAERRAEAEQAEPEETDEDLDDGHWDEEFYETEEDEDVSAAEPEQIHAESTDDIEALFAELGSEMPPPLFLGMPGTKDYIFSGHSGAGPSGAERWMNCTASLQASREFLETLSPEQQEVFAGSNTAARQGTTAHAAAEVEARLLLGEIDQSEADFTLMELAASPEDADEAYNEEMAEYITEYTDLIKTYVDAGHTVHIETRVSAAVPLTEPVGHDLAEVHTITGSADAIIEPTSADPILTVIDLKYGNGIYVDVESNPQVRIYGLGALAELADPETGQLPEGLEEIEYVIVQPRLGGIRTWRESIDDLLDWRDEELSPAITKALRGVEGGAEFNPAEETCQFCPARGGCAALAEQRIEQAADMFDVIVESEFADGPGSFPETTSLTDDRLGELLTQITGLIDIHKDLKEEASRRLNRGLPVPGFKLVSYSPPRKWREGAETEFEDTEDLWTTKMVSPTQAYKLLGDGAEAALDKWVEKPNKRPVVAPHNDRRKEWTGLDAESMFEIETGED